MSYCPECGAPIGILAHRNGGPACHECEARISTDDLVNESRRPDSDGRDSSQSDLSDFKQSLKNSGETP